MTRFLFLVPLVFASCAAARNATEASLPVRTIRGVRGKAAIDPTGEVAVMRPCPPVAGNRFDDGRGISTENDVWASVDEVLKGRFADGSQESLRLIREALFESMKTDMMRTVQLDTRLLSDDSLVVDVNQGGSYSGISVVISLKKTGNGYDVQRLGVRSWSCVNKGAWVRGIHGTVAVDVVPEDDIRWLVGVFDLSGIDAPWDETPDAPVSGSGVHVKGSFRLDVARIRNTLQPWIAEDLSRVDDSR